MATFHCNELPVFPETPNQPTVNFPFPKRSFGKTKPVLCSVKSYWFKMWPFLHYNEAQDAMYCHTCVKAFVLRRIKSNHNASTAFENTLRLADFGVGGRDIRNHNLHFCRSLMDIQTGRMVHNHSKNMNYLIPIQDGL